MKYLLIILMLVAPVAGPGSWVFIIAVASSVTAYEGLKRVTVYSMLAALLGVELVYGLDVGVLSLSYVIAVLMLTFAGRILVIAPWTASRGWHVSDALRVLMVACALFAVIAACGVIVGHFLYGYAQVGSRLQTLFLPHRTVWMPVVIAVILTILRRRDEPFRRNLIFGT